ncbi:hypothetical protein JX266_007972 [Neoarthrinium moseri]|nr:hypothetical protein JX266_007972 [Neoarthrinium moseri]
MQKSFSPPPPTEAELKELRRRLWYKEITPGLLKQCPPGKIPFTLLPESPKRRRPRHRPQRTVVLSERPLSTPTFGDVCKTPPLCDLSFVDTPPSWDADLSNLSASTYHSGQRDLKATKLSSIPSSLSAESFSAVSLGQLGLKATKLSSIPSTPPRQSSPSPASDSTGSLLRLVREVKRFADKGRAEREALRRELASFDFSDDPFTTSAENFSAVPLGQPDQKASKPSSTRSSSSLSAESFSAVSLGQLGLKASKPSSTRSSSSLSAESLSAVQLGHLDQKASKPSSTRSSSSLSAESFSAVQLGHLDQKASKPSSTRSSVSAESFSAVSLGHLGLKATKLSSIPSTPPRQSSPSPSSSDSTGSLLRIARAAKRFADEGRAEREAVRRELAMFNFSPCTPPSQPLQTFGDVCKTPPPLCDISFVDTPPSGPSEASTWHTPSVASCDSTPTLLRMARQMKKECLQSAKERAEWIHEIEPVDSSDSDIYSFDTYDLLVEDSVDMPGGFTPSPPRSHQERIRAHFHSARQEPVYYPAPVVSSEASGRPRAASWMWKACTAAAVTVAAGLGYAAYSWFTS